MTDLPTRPLIDLLAIALAQLESPAELAAQIEEKIVDQDKTPEAPLLELRLEFGFMMLPGSEKKVLCLLYGIGVPECTFQEVVQQLEMPSDRLKKRIRDGRSFLQMIGLCRNEQVEAFLRKKGRSA